MCENDFALAQTGTGIPRALEKTADSPAEFALAQGACSVFRQA